MIVTGSADVGREPFRPKENHKMPKTPATFAQPGQPGRATPLLQFDTFKNLQLQAVRPADFPPSPH